MITVFAKAHLDSLVLKHRNCLGITRSGMPNFDYAAYCGLVDDVIGFYSDDDSFHDAKQYLNDKHGIEIFDEDCFDGRA